MLNPEKFSSEKNSVITDYIQNNKDIRKFLSNLDKNDLQFFQDLVEKGLDPKAKENVIRFKQILRHGTVGFTIPEIISLRKSFKNLQNL